MAEFDIQGLDGVLAKFAEVKVDVQKKGGRFALRKAAQIVRDAARVNSRQHDDSATGRTFAANITEKWNGRLNKSTGDLGFRVGVNQGAVLPKKGEHPDEGPGGPTPHWRLIELGTEKSAAHPFLVPAMKANISTATNEFVRQYGKALTRAINRAKKGS